MISKYLRKMLVISLNTSSIAFESSEFHHRLNRSSIDSPWQVLNNNRKSQPFRCRPNAAPFDPGKHFVHDPVQLVQTSLASVPQLNPSVGYHAQDKIVYQRQRQHRHQLQPTSGILSHTKGGAGSHAVSIISGGGSGHEPSFASYVGEGLLTAAVAGSIFASPSAEQIRRALERVNTTRGVLVLVMNYTVGGPFISLALCERSPFRLYYIHHYLLICSWLQ